MNDELEMILGGSGLGLLEPSIRVEGPTKILEKP
jgi:hypothetical protein